MISVIVPVYKVEDYLSRCVDSVLAQTEKDFELILVDDGSPDRCGEICDAYAQKDKRIHVVHKSNGGLSDARNAGLKIAEGEYIAFVDSDDWVEKEYLEKLLSGIENADICECEMIRTDGTAVIPQKQSEIIRYSGSDALKNLITDQLFHQYVWNKLYCRNVIAGILFETGKTNEDEFWTYQAFGNAKTVIRISDVLYNYFQRPGSIMGNRYSIKRLDSLEAKKQRQAYLEQKYPDISFYGKKNLFYSYVYAGQMTVKYLTGNERAEAERIINECREEYRLNEKEIHNCSLYEKTWIRLMNRNFWFGCRLRNLFRKGF